jgi:aspartate racemase
VKTIGLIGGMSWESTLVYYRIINERIKKKLGGLHSAKILLYSVDFEEIEKLQRQGNWKKSVKIMADIAKKLEHGGAELLVVCTNTMHIIADDIKNSITMPLLHIADATADKIKLQGLRKIGLLGTAFTMEKDFYTGRLAKKYGMEVLIPKAKDRQMIHDIIYKELCLGKIKQGSKNKFVRAINELAACGAEAVILGCTEISMLVQQNDVNPLLFDTTRIHAEAAAEMALKK